MKVWRAQMFRWITMLADELERRLTALPRPDRHRAELSIGDAGLGGDMRLRLALRARLDSGAIAINIADDATAVQIQMRNGAEHATLMMPLLAPIDAYGAELVEIDVRQIAGVAFNLLVWRSVTEPSAVDRLAEITT